MNAVAEHVDGLTAEQAAVVDRPVDSRTLLIAPAGTGKTHTLVRRLERLLGDDVAADEVLVLSFSRAAVRELASRVTAAAGHSRFVAARTFDAWALELVEDVYAGQDWHLATFDERIAAATEALLAGHADDRVSRLRHVLLDEVQDLVGRRKELVQALLTTAGCGFTMVGDPAQAIYGFQSRDRAAAGQPDVFDWTRTAYGADLAELELTHDFRARSPRPPGVLACGRSLRSAAAADEQTSRQVRHEFLNTMSAGGVEDAASGFAYFDGTTAILCRDNGQALEVSRMLHLSGAAHRLQRRSGDEGAPAWLASLLRRHGGLRADRSAVAEHSGVDGEHLEIAWQNLLAVARAGSDSVDLARLRTGLARRRLSRIHPTAGPAVVTVSSMHRAKGLEYDRVFVLADRPRKNTDQTEESRLLYMALTRCRDDVFRLDPLEQTGGTYAGRCRHTGRWARYHFTRRGMRLGLAVDGDDVAHEYPPGTSVFTDDPIALQDHLAEQVKAGDPVTLRRADEPADDDLAVPQYVVEHNGRPIAVASATFRRALARYMHGDKPPAADADWPTALTDCWIDDVEAVAGSVASGNRAGLGTHGVWLAPRLSGLTWFRYTGSDSENDDE